MGGPGLEAYSSQQPGRPSCGALETADPSLPAFTSAPSTPSCRWPRPWLRRRRTPAPPWSSPTPPAPCRASRCAEPRMLCVLCMLCALGVLRFATHECRLVAALWPPCLRTRPQTPPVCCGCSSPSLLPQGGMSSSLNDAKLAVDSGYWPLYRYQPGGWAGGVGIRGGQWGRRLPCGVPHAKACILWGIPGPCRFLDLREGCAREAEEPARPGGEAYTPAPPRPAPLARRPQRPQGQAAAGQQAHQGRPQVLPHPGEQVGAGQIMFGGGKGRRMFGGLWVYLGA